MHKSEIPRNTMCGGSECVAVDVSFKNEWLPIQKPKRKKQFSNELKRKKCDFILKRTAQNNCISIGEQNSNHQPAAIFKTYIYTAIQQQHSRINIRMCRFGMRHEQPREREEKNRSNTL